MEVRSEDVTNSYHEDRNIDELDMKVPFIDDGAQDDKSDDQQFQEDLDIFIAGFHRYFSGRNLEFEENRANRYRSFITHWNEFHRQGKPSTSGIVSSDDYNRIKDFSRLYERKDGKNDINNNNGWIISTIITWNVFLQARQGIPPVTKCGAILTTAILLLYVLDMISDIGTVFIYGCNGNWLACLLTLLLLHIGIIASSMHKWTNGWLHFETPLDILRYIVSCLFVNWPDVKEFCCFAGLEWKLCRSHKSNAFLVPEWQRKRQDTAKLKYTEGVSEACPQVVLQLCLLFSELGDVTWTVYLRLASLTASLCTAGASLVNQEKVIRIGGCNDLSVCEFLALLLWAVPVTVSRLLSVSLLLTMNLLAGIIFLLLHIVLHGIHTYFAYNSVDKHVSWMSQNTFSFLVSPFIITDSWPFFLVAHCVHFLCNVIINVMWIATTPLACTHPVLYIVIIAFSSALFPVGLLGWFIHKKCWPREYYWKQSSVANR